MNPLPDRIAAAIDDFRQSVEEDYSDGLGGSPSVGTSRIRARLEAAIAELAAERDRYHSALVARHGGEPLALLSELDEARAERDAARQELNELDIYLRCQGTQGDSALDRAKRIVANTSLPGYVRLVEERDAAVAKCAELERERAYYKLVSEGWSDAEARGEVWPAAAEQGGA